MPDKIQITVIVTTKNEQAHVAQCLNALRQFCQIIVVDSHSSDRTCEIAKEHGAEVVLYEWDGRYPKKRQWCLEELDLKCDYVFMVDADEVIPPSLIDEISMLNLSNSMRCAGYFISGSYIWSGRALKYGMKNNKLALFDSRKLEYPVVDDLDIDGMGEMEGHYQPVLKREYAATDSISFLNSSLFHYAYDDKVAWDARHVRYAHWEAALTQKDAWPEDPIAFRQVVKKLTRRSCLRPYLMFFYSFVFKLGFLDGCVGYHFARSRFAYCKMVCSLLVNK